MYDITSKELLPEKQGEDIDPISLEFWETKIYIVEKEGMTPEEQASNAENTMPVMGPDGKPMRCAKTGRMMAQFVQPHHITPRSKATLRIEPNMQTFNTSSLTF